MKNSLGGLMQQFDSKHIMGSAKQAYDNKKREEAIAEEYTKKFNQNKVQELEKQTLTQALWNILGISINPENIRRIDVDTGISMYAGVHYVPAITVENITFVYDARFECPTPISSGRVAEVWADNGLRIWGECNKYNGYNFPCGYPGLSKRIRTRHDLGEILSEGIKADHSCRDPWPDW